MTKFNYKDHLVFPLGTRLASRLFTEDALCNNGTIIYFGPSTKYRKDKTHVLFDIFSQMWSLVEEDYLIKYYKKYNNKK